MDDRHVITEIAWTVLAVAGGVAKHLNSVVTEKQPLKPILLVCRAFVSGFSGYMFAKTAILVLPDAEWAMVSAGVGGYVGVEVIDYIVLVVKSKVLPGKL